MELLSLINDILDLSKVEAGKINITRENIHLDMTCNAVSQQFQPVAQQSGVAMIMRIDDSLGETLHTDGQRLEQILKNLLSNAFKFTKSGSVTLDIHTAKTIFPRPVRLQSIAFSVIDTGIGIEKSKLNDIFEAFQQEDGSIDRHYGGTGLGLTSPANSRICSAVKFVSPARKGKAALHAGSPPVPGTDIQRPAPRRRLSCAPCARNRRQRAEVHAGDGGSAVHCR